MTTRSNEVLREGVKQGAIFAPTSKNRDGERKVSSCHIEDDFSFEARSLMVRSNANSCFCCVFWNPLIFFLGMRTLGCPWHKVLTNISRLRIMVEVDASETNPMVVLFHTMVWRSQQWCQKFLIIILLPWWMKSEGFFVPKGSDNSCLTHEN